VLERDSLREDGAARRTSAAVIAACTVLGAAARLASLRALPVFGDETINLRLAVLARRDLLARLWISLQEAQPPLHVWLLALVLPVSPDPVLSGRLPSAAAGIACVPAAAWAALRILEAFRTGPDRSGIEERMASVATAALVGLGPFFVFAQRLARVDALFLLEAALASGLSVEPASRAGSGRGRLLPLGAAFGLLMGLTMLTRQAVSYPLWLLAPVAWSLLPPQRRAEPGSGRRLFAALALAAVVAAALWVPMLAAPGAPDTVTRIFHSADYRPEMGLGARLGLMLSNLRPAGEAFGLYLTPPVLLLAALGALGLLEPARRRLLAFLLLWEAILLAPTAAFAASYFPRYALPAALPVCVFAALGFVGLWQQIRRRVRRPAVQAALTLLVAMLVIGPSLRDLWLGLRSWRDWPLLPIDHAQFVSGSSAGFASEAAAGWLRARAVERPLTVLAPEISGNPTDGVWLLLDGDPAIRLSYAPDALRRPLLPPADADGTRRLPGDARDDLRTPVVVPAGESVYAVVPDPLLTRSGWVAAVPFLSRLNTGLSEAARFENPAEPGSPVNAVVVLRLPGVP
jgi:hypothetical protein